MNAPQGGFPAKVKAFEKALAASSNTFSSVLPAHLPVKRFLRTVVGAVQNNPTILNCNQDSILKACQKAAQDGLVIDGREAAIVPFKDQAQYMPMLAGILKKLRNSGELSTITAQAVYSNDPFNYNPAMDDVPNHSPDWFGDRGDMIGVYAIAKMKDGSSAVEIMSLRDIEKVRAVSRGKDRGPWVDWYEEMAKKTVVRRLCKYLPSSADVDQLLDRDDENNAPDLPATRSKTMSRVINGTAERVNEPEPESRQAPAESDMEDMF